MQRCGAGRLGVLCKVQAQPAEACIVVVLHGCQGRGNLCIEPMHRQHGGYVVLIRHALPGHPLTAMGGGVGVDGVIGLLRQHLPAPPPARPGQEAPSPPWSGGAPVSADGAACADRARSAVCCRYSPGRTLARLPAAAHLDPGARQTAAGRCFPRSFARAPRHSVLQTGDTKLLHRSRPYIQLNFSGASAPHNKRQNRQRKG